MTLQMIELALSAVLVGAMTYMLVWGLHNFEITADSIMPWADKQETFFQKMISCMSCLSVQLAVALSSLHCLAFGMGLWRWAGITVLSSLVSLWLGRALIPLDRVR